MKGKRFLLCLLALCAVECTEKEDGIISNFDGLTQGTTYHIVVKSDRPLFLQAEIDSLLKVVDNSMSLYNPASLLCRLNRNETDSLDDFITGCIRTADSISRESGGLYDVTIKPLTSAYGFAGDSVVQHPNVDSLLQFVGYEKISVENGRLRKSDPRVQIDLNSIAQGATSDFIAKYFDKVGFTDYLIEVGGEIFCKGHKTKGRPWVVGVDRPFEGNFTPGADLMVHIGMTNRGLATSGNYRKFYTDDNGRKIVHTVNAKTGQPFMSSLLSATVVAENATKADAYGTMMLLFGLEKSKEYLAAHPEVQAYLVYSDDKGNFQTYVTPELQSMIVE